MDMGSIIIRSCDIKGGHEGTGINIKDKLFVVYEDNIDADPLFVDADRGDYRLKT